MIKASAIIFIILFFIISCGEEKKKLSLGVIQNSDKLYCDTALKIATILFDEKNILEIGIQKDTIDGKLYEDVYWTAGFYETIKDTLYITFPSYPSKEYTHVNTKYFWYDTTDVDRGLTLFMDADKLADSLFKRHFKNHGVITCTFANAKAIIKSDKVVYFK